MNELLGKPIYGEFIRMGEDMKLPMCGDFEYLEMLDTIIYNVCKSSLVNEYIVNSYYLVPSNVIERIRKYS